MKKDRNTFFGESNYMSQTTIPNYPNIPNSPYTTTSYGNQGFYAGPMNTPVNYNTNQGINSNYNDYSDIEARLSKIERQISRLDNRLSKLETSNLYTTDDIETTNNIYMV